MGRRGASDERQVWASTRTNSGMVRHVLSLQGLELLVKLAPNSKPPSCKLSPNGPSL